MKVLVNERLSEHKYKTPEGYLICVDSILARTGKQTYQRDELFHDGDTSEVEVDRLEDEVFAKETLASFENKPITVEHPDENVNAENYKDYSVGFVRDVHRGDFNGEPVILGTLVITDAQTIKEIEDGEHTELSCGYDCDIEDEENPQQKNIRGNHVALCQRGRAGIAKIVDSIDDEEYRKGKPKKYKQFTLYERADDRRDYITEDNRLLKRYEYYKNGKTYSIIWKVNNKFYKDLYDAIYESNPLSINKDWLSRSGEINAKNTATIVLEKDEVNDAFEGPGTYVVNGGKDGTFDISSKEMYEKCLKENPDIKTLERRKLYSHGDFGKFSGKYWNDSINDEKGFAVVYEDDIEFFSSKSQAINRAKELSKTYHNIEVRTYNDDNPSGYAANSKVVWHDEAELDVEDEPMIYLNYLNKLNKAETKEKRDEILENAKRSVLEEKLQQKDYERLASHFNDAAYTLSGYDKVSLLKEDIKEAKRRGLEAWMENSDGERQLFVRGDAKKLKDYVDNYLGLDSSGITDSIEDTPVSENDINNIDSINYVVGKNGVWFAKAKNESQLLTIAYCSADKGKTWHKCYLETKSDAPSGRTQAGKMFFRTSANFPGPRTSIGRNILTWYANNGIHRINEMLEIDHVNGKYTDDRLSNLERITRNENIRRMQMNLRRNDSINNKLVKIIRAIDAKKELTFNEYIEKMYGISSNDLSDDDYDGLHEEWLNEKPYWTKDKSKIRKAKQTDSIKDINIEELPRKRQIHIFCEEFMNKNGLNNSIGKYDKAIQATKNLLAEGFLTGDKLKESTIREFKRMLKKYNSDDDKVKTL